MQVTVRQMQSVSDTKSLASNEEIIEEFIEKYSCSYIHFTVLVSFIIWSRHTSNKIQRGVCSESLGKPNKLSLGENPMLKSINNTRPLIEYKRNK